MNEPDLTQAVRIVLKYEIQSLLTRLADTGEEYLVITASTDEKTCGHIGSVKGETFLHNSGLQNVKQDFLNFCSGQSTEVKEEPKEDSYTSSSPVVQAPKQHRRKSIPRCRSQQTSLESSHDSPSSANRPVARDSSDKNHSIGSESRDQSNEILSTIIKTEPLDSDSGGGVIQNAMFGTDEDLLSKQNAHKSAYSWCEEKLVIDSEVGSAAKTEDVAVPVSIQRPLNPKQRNNTQLNGSAFIKQDGMAKVPIKIAQTSSIVPHKRIGQMESLRNNESPKPGIEVISSNWAIKKIDQVDSGLNITDMKSAFIEIGSMAKCLLCNKILSNKNNRTFHWRSHVGDKRYACDICDKKFTHPSNMRSHRKIHTGEKPFSCELCGRRFRRRDYLFQHMEKFHCMAKSPDAMMLDEAGNDNTTEGK